MIISISKIVPNSTQSPSSQKARAFPQSQLGASTTDVQPRFKGPCKVGPGMVAQNHGCASVYHDPRLRIRVAVALGWSLAAYFRIQFAEVQRFSYNSVRSIYHVQFVSL